MRFQLSIMKTVLAKPLRLLLLGAPGAGKGTQTSRVLKLVSGLNAISSGDLLRQEIQQHSKLGDIAQSYISEGKLVPDSFMVDLIHSNLSQRNWLEPQISWLLDGFPRTLNQAQELDKKLATYKAQINLVVELDVPEQVILNRIENRWVVSFFNILFRQIFFQCTNYHYSIYLLVECIIWSIILQRIQVSMMLPVKN